jgi:hypothetical protein
MPRRQYCKKCGQPLTYRTVAQVRRLLEKGLAYYDARIVEAKAEDSIDFTNISRAVAGESLAERVRTAVLQMRGECGGGELCEHDAAKREEERDAAA